MKKSLFLSLAVGACLFAVGATSLYGWTPSVAISEETSSVNPTPPHVSIDQNSNTLVGWLAGYVGSGLNLYTANLPAAAPAWGRSVALFSSTPPEYPTFPIVFADSTGSSHAAWSTYTQDGGVFNQTVLYSAVQPTLGSSWGEPIVTPAQATIPKAGSVGIDQQGNMCGVLAVGPDSSTYAPPYTIQFMALASDATAWIGPFAIGTDSVGSGAAVFAAAAQGEAILGWKVSPALELQSARYTFGDTELSLIGNVPLPAGTTDVGYTRAALSESGDTVCIFNVQIGEDTKYMLYSTFLPKGSSTWSFPELISNPENNTNGYTFSLNVDLQGNATLLWTETTPSNNAFVNTANLPFGGLLTNVQSLTDTSAVPGNTIDQNSQNSIQVDSFGNAVAIWGLTIGGTTPTIQTASRSAGGNWSSVTTLSNSGGQASVALSDQGTAVAAWIDTNTGLLMGSTSNHIFPLASPSGFAGYVTSSGGDYLLKMHWKPSKAPNIISYEIFQAGTLIGNVGAEGPFEYTNTLNCPDVENEYTLVAVASNGNKSTPITLTVTE